jgi:hypothetical protein
LIFSFFCFSWEMPCFFMFGDNVFTDFLLQSFEFFLKTIG